MNNIAFITLSHIDATLPLVKYFNESEDINIDLYCVFTQKYKRATPINFTEKDIPNGYIDEVKSKKYLDNAIIKYLGKQKLKMFIMKNSNILNLYNWYLLFKFANMIKKTGYNKINLIGNHHWIVILNILLHSNVVTHTVHEPRSHYGRNKFKDRVKIILINKCSNIIILPSRVSYKRFDKIFGEKNRHKIRCVPFSIMNIYNYYLQEEVFVKEGYLLFFGRINQYKGVKYLIEAMEKLYDINPEIKCIIFGKGCIEDRYLDIAKKINVEIINKYIKNNQIASYVNNARFIICPYTSASQSAVIMTAFAFGKTIISTDVEGINNVVENNYHGLLVKPKDSHQLYLEILKLWNDRDKILFFENNIKKDFWYGKYSWQKIIEENKNEFI